MTTITVQEISQRDLSIKMIVSGWNVQAKRINELINKLTDEQLYAQVAPGRNRGIYLLGHLVAITDAMMPLLGGGDRLYPELENSFVRNADKADEPMPTPHTLKQYWTIVNERLTDFIANLPADEWFTRHTAVSEEDFAKEPTRNKLNILLSRTSHGQYHLGQMIFLSTK